MRPLTLEEAIKNLDKALTNGDREEIAKWDSIIRKENDYRMISRERDRDIYNQSLRLRIRQSYKL